MDGKLKDEFDRMWPEKECPDCAEARVLRYSGKPRPILYTDTINGEQVCVDNLWAITTEELNRVEVLEKVAEAARRVDNTPEWHEGAFCDARNSLFDAIAALDALKEG